MTRGSTPPNASNPFGAGSGSTPGRAGPQLATPSPSTSIGRYQVLEKIGEGGMGSLFLARDPAIDRLLAIKLLRRGLDTDALRERFAREARAAGRLRHPHIVTVFDVGEHDGDPFIAMEFLAGETLSELIRNNARLSLARRLKLLEELCDGLAYAHRAGLVHRDIKPANLMVDADGVLKILDFGIVRVSDSGMTQAGVLVGTVNYMSPEQVVGAVVDHRSDIFAVGLVAYELISGRQAFAGSIKEGLLNRILNVAFEPLTSVVPGLDAEVASIVDQALKKDPAERYQELARMRNDLARARARIERAEEQAASEAAADAGETAVIAHELTLAEPGPAPPRPASSPAIVQDAERALADGNFRAALTLAGRSAAINPQDRAASDIAAKAEAALLDRGRQLNTAAPASSPSGGVPLPPATAPSAAGLQNTRAVWIAVGTAMLALAIAVIALWSRSRSEPPAPASIARSEPAPASAPQAPPAPREASVPPPPTRGGEASRSPSTPATSTEPPSSSAAEPAQPLPPAVAPAAPKRADRPAVTARSQRPASRSEPPTSAKPDGNAAVPGASTAAPSEAPVAPGAPLRVGGDVPAPRRLRGAQPAYPRDAQAAGIQGTVIIDATIGPDGRVVDARVVRSVRGLDEAALSAVREWQYEPPRYRDAPASVIQAVSVSFELPEPPRTAAAPDSKGLPSSPTPKPPEAPRTAPVPDVQEEIREVLRRYQAAWEGRNIAGLRRIQLLSESEAAQVAATMSEAERLTLDVQVEAITVDPSGRSAVANCAIVRRFKPRRGFEETRTTRNAIRLEKRDAGWLIVSIR